MKKILAITTIRSDYDLMSGLYRLLHNDESIELKLLVGGAHLSETYGLSVNLIEKDGFEELIRLETLIDSNSRSARLKAASLLLQNSIDIVAGYNPELIIYAGDREDVLVGAMLGGYLKIPTAHFFAGDHVSDGHIDNSVRHAVSKLSSVHFVCLDEHRQRLIKMGESQERIFVIGSPALDRFLNPEGLAGIDQVLNDNFKVEINKWQDYAIMIFHPILSEEAMGGKNAQQILECLKDKDIKTFIGYPNTDPGNKDIINVYKQFFSNYPKMFQLYKNLDRESFVSLFKHARFIIGNSSSGILEAATIKIPAINVGNRQKGRIVGANVIFVEQNKDSINQAIDNALSDEFKKKISGIKNPYGEGDSCKIAYDLIKNIDFDKFVLKKEDPLKL